jgi:ABC-type thiamine transport system substrate-binding protein
LWGFFIAGLVPATAADTVNVYSIWPENWARPMFEEFEKATGVKVNFVQIFLRRGLARVKAEKKNPRIDVLFGGPWKPTLPASPTICSTLQVPFLCQAENRL